MTVLTSAHSRTRSTFLPNAHPRWSLHRAELVKCEEDLVVAAGLPAPSGRR